MNARINKLRQESLDAVSCISAERAQLVTEFYQSKQAENLSPVKKRAYCLSHILYNKHICINDGELIVGERGPAPKATSTYPEVCLHSIQDLEILDSREKVSFKVSEETKKIYKEEIIPYWTGKTNREKIFEALPKEWKDCYNAGIFTEFQEQRAPGHTVLGADMFKKGMSDLAREIAEYTDFTKEGSSLAEIEKEDEYMAMIVVIDAINAFAKRHVDELHKLASEEQDAHRKSELIEMARICRKVPNQAPETVHEALQHYWFIHLGVITEVNPWDSFNPGRLDQHLWPLYKKELEEGSITEERMYELLQAFWIKFNNHPAPPKMGVTALESNTYTDFALINMGGLTEDGEDAVNPVSYMILEVIKEMRLLQPSSMIQVSEKNPDSFIEKAMEIVKTGFGQPSIFNTEAIIQELVNQGKSLIDARNGGCSGCVETGAFGTEAYLLTGYFNLAKILELTLNRGIDPLTNKQLGLITKEPRNFTSLEDLLEEYKKQIQYFADIKLNGNDIIEKIFMKNIPVPFLSILISDCIKNGKDYMSGGARYNSSYIQGVGLGSTTDMLTSLKYHVFDNKTYTMDSMLKAIKDNYIGHDKILRELIFKTPKYGNDDDYADENANIIFETFHSAIDGRKTPRGGTYRINMLPTTCHVYFGSKTGATPDGRLAGEPFSEGISPFQGTDTQGPTAVLKSASKFNHLKTGGTLLNQKFTPSLLSDEKGIKNIVHLVRAYFKMQGHHIQFNVVDEDTLKHAQEYPHLHKDLIVRVAGYSDYFNDLGEDLQNEIIRRTEQQCF
jgi:formate C-acetyltransferase